MGFKSRNWENLAETDLAVRVMYTTDELRLQIHGVGEVAHQVPTVMVAVMDATTAKIFVGVSRCSPKDQYEAKLGREIAAGRALSLWKKFNKKTPRSMAQQKVAARETGAKFKVIASSENDLALFLGEKVPEAKE